MSMNAKRMEKAHKPLVSADVMAGSGWDQWLTAGGGYIYKSNSKVAKQIAALLEAETHRADAQMLPLWEEGGVYNFYLHMGDKSQVSEVNGLAKWMAPWPTKVDKDSVKRTPGTPPFTRPPPQV